MKRHTKITLQEIMKRKEQMLEAKKEKKTAEIYIESLDGTIIIQEPSRSLCKDAIDMPDGEGDTYLIYECVVEPNLKSQELQEAFGCVEPMEIVEKIFEAGEIPKVSTECLRLAGFSNEVKRIEQLKN